MQKIESVVKKDAAQLKPFSTDCPKCGDFPEYCDCPMNLETLHYNVQNMTLCEFVNYLKQHEERLNECL